MKIKKKIIIAKGIKVYFEENNHEAGRASLFILKNDLRNRKFGYLEDVFVDEKFRGQGLGKRLVNEIIRVAKINGCYKIVATSRYNRRRVHKLYESLGFKKFGYEYKNYLDNADLL